MSAPSSAWSPTSTINAFSDSDRGATISNSNGSNNNGSGNGNSVSNAAYSSSGNNNSSKSTVGSVANKGNSNNNNNSNNNSNSINSSDKRDSSSTKTAAPDGLGQSVEPVSPSRRTHFGQDTATEPSAALLTEIRGAVKGELAGVFGRFNASMRAEVSQMSEEFLRELRSEIRRLELLQQQQQPFSSSVSLSQSEVDGGTGSLNQDTAARRAREAAAAMSRLRGTSQDYSFGTAPIISSNSLPGVVAEKSCDLPPPTRTEMEGVVRPKAAYGRRRPYRDAAEDRSSSSSPKRPPMLREASFNDSDSDASPGLPSVKHAAFAPVAKEPSGQTRTSTDTSDSEESRKSNSDLMREEILNSAVETNDALSLGIRQLKRKQQRLKASSYSSSVRRSSTFRQKTSRDSATQLAVIQARLEANNKIPLGDYLTLQRLRGQSWYHLIYHTLCWVVKADFFDYFIGFFLLGNAVLIGVQADYYARTLAKEVPVSFQTLDLFFCFFFLLECLLRFSVEGFAFFKGINWRWNLFDVTIVVFQMFDEFVKVFLTDTLVEDGMSNLGVLRVLRLARLLRLVRMVRLIPELKSMVYLIVASMGSFVWSVVLILIIMYCFAIYYTEIVTDLLQEGSVEDPVTQAALQKSWGGVFHSILSLWMAITGGDDWRNFLDGLEIDSVYIMHVLFFVIYIAFGTLVMLNLVTGVFVEGAQRIIKEDKDTELLNMASRIFQRPEGQSGENDNREISWKEFQEQLLSGSMDEYIKAIGISISEAEHLYDLLDTDDSGTVSIAEFVRGCLRLRGTAKSMDLAEMEYKMRESFAAMTLVMLRATGKIFTMLSKNTKEVEMINSRSSAWATFSPFDRGSVFMGRDGVVLPSDDSFLEHSVRDIQAIINGLGGDPDNFGDGVLV